MRSRHTHVIIDLDRIRATAEAIRHATGVRLIAVIKADAYGLGASPIADALASVADEFAYFSIHEAREVGRPGIVLGPPEGDAAQYRELNLRPAVSNLAEVERYVGLPVAINLDTGMQRFGCRPAELDDLLGRCQATDIFTHAMALPAAQMLHDICRGKKQWHHAASTSLLNCPTAWLDGVRPGLALYQGAVHVSTSLHTVRQTAGTIGYTNFEHPYVGTILTGYSNNTLPGPVLINGRRQRILEVGMNTSFVSIDPRDRPGDEVVLLGDGLIEAELATHFGCREHEILCRYTSMGQRSYITTSVSENNPAASKMDSADTTRSNVSTPQQT